METTTEGVAEMLKGVAIRPPRLEDAGLEDCALPPDAIREAFARAATAFKSRLTCVADEEDDDASGCVHDPRPSNGDASDVVLLGDIPTPPSCGGAAEKAEAAWGSEDKVVVQGVDEGDTLGDEVIVLGGEEAGKKSCVVDGKEEEEEEKKRKGSGEEGEDGEQEEKPILVEDLI